MPLFVIKCSLFLLGYPFNACSIPIFVWPITITIIRSHYINKNVSIAGSVTSWLHHQDVEWGAWPIESLLDIVSMPEIRSSSSRHHPKLRLWCPGSHQRVLRHQMRKRRGRQMEDKFWVGLLEKNDKSDKMSEPDVYYVFSENPG